MPYLFKKKVRTVFHAFQYCLFVCHLFVTVIKVGGFAWYFTEHRLMTTQSETATSRTLFSNSFQELNYLAYLHYLFTPDSKWYSFPYVIKNSLLVSPTILSVRQYGEASNTLQIREVIFLHAYMAPNWCNLFTNCTVHSPRISVLKNTQIHMKTHRKQY